MKNSLRLFYVWSGIFIVSLLPVLFWHLFGTGFRSGFFEYSVWTHGLGVIFGLVGMTMFALTFLFSTKMRWVENIVGGLDKSYMVHGILGGVSLIAVLAHPIFLVLKFIPGQFYAAASYLLPGVHWSVNFGIFSLLVFAFLIFLTLFVKMKYNKWKFSHEFLGLVFLFAVIHVFLIRGSISQGNIFYGYYVYAAVVSFIGLFSFCYSFFYKRSSSNYFRYVVKSIDSVGDFFKITISPEKEGISYIAGQFVFVKFISNKISKEAHPFSIASRTGSDDLVIVVKKLGDYTSNLFYLKVGDKALIDGPYGKFNYKKCLDRNQVWIAGGIGVTPFIGMVQDLLSDSKLEGNIDLIYSAKEEKELVGNEIFKRIEKKSSKFRYFPWVSSKNGRLNEKKIFELIGKFRDREFFICGSENFKESLIPSLIRNGVKKNNIHEEDFNFK